ncbi:hypothetical protein [Rhizobium sp. BK176]|uniref:hypothetical protein n=1 Tax=Rhizobium sp. BK176 TaxID=2587071 RepID=UPI002168CA7B|nr:hypothetical protein [Rhizobium sp. BK176]MCS4088871.1 hypothetical protein [Rhizobium sp. BK176]
MMIKHTFVNRIIGVAAGGFRDVSLNYVYDSAAFNLIDRDPSDFPIATRHRGIQNSNRLFARDYTTRWHDDSHWTHVGDAGQMRLETALEPLGTSIVAGSPDGQQVFPLDTAFKGVVENMRDEKIVAVQSHFDRNIALIDGEIWRRANEPCYCLRLDDTKDGRKVMGVFRESALVEHTLSGRIKNFDDRGYRGQRFRLDDAHGFREAVLDHIDLGWTLQGSDGVEWGVPDIEVLIPESIALDPEAQTVVDIACSLVEPARRRMKEMSYQELDAACLLFDAFEHTRPESGRFTESQIGDLMDAVLSLAKYDYKNSGISPAARELAAERWENRAIGDFLPVRSHDAAF